MRRRPREPLALAALALAAAVACAPPADPPAARPTTPPPTPSATAARTPATTVLGTATTKPYVVGVLGDWGIDTPAVRQVVQAMTRFNGGRALDAVLTTGDNAYCCGTDAQSRFARRLLAPLRLAGAPVHPALGNHDNATEGGAAFMRVFGMTRRWYTVNVGPVQFVVLDSNRTSSATQLTFLKGVLAKPRPGRFRVVLFHHPAWSCSAHGPDPGVRDRWLPLFGTRVDLVLAGHNHTYERFRATNGTPYVTTGGGGARLYASAGAACRGTGKMQYLKTVHHAVRLTATATSLRLEAIGVNGVAFDTITLAPR